MIILELEEEFVLVTQNDHAKISGEAAECWKDEFFTDWTGKKEVVLAVREHDRCWTIPWVSPITQQLWLFPPSSLGQSHN